MCMTTGKDIHHLLNMEFLGVYWGRHKTRENKNYGQTDLDGGCRTSVAAFLGRRWCSCGLQHNITVRKTDIAKVHLIPAENEVFCFDMQLYLRTVELTSGSLALPMPLQRGVRQWERCITCAQAVYAGRLQGGLIHLADGLLTCWISTLQPL